MKKLIQFSIEYPVTIMMVILGVLLLGYISFDRLSIDLFPDLNNPRLFIDLQVGEKPPEEIEKNYTKAVESIAIQQKGVTQVSSVTKVGVAQITVEYSWDKDMDEAFLDLQKTVTSLAQNLEVDDISISQVDPNSDPVMTVAFSNPNITDMDNLRKTAENYIRNELIRIEGIADIELVGIEEKEIDIETNNYMLAAHSLTLEQLKSQIEKFNANISGGSIVEMGKKYIIKGVSVFQTIDDIKKTIVSYKLTAEGDSLKKVPVYLSDVASVVYKNKDPENIVRLNGKRCVGLSVYKETKYNTVKAIEELKVALKEISNALPGYEFVVIQNQGEFIQNSIEEVEETALIGIILAVLILYIFLRHIGTTTIISIAIPISIVATFNLMYFNGLTLNIMTLGGLALGAGMLVDNAIVVMENIFRNLEAGESVKEAAIKGTSQVGGAIISSTVTTIIVFLPIVYLHGASGELFKDQAWTVAFSLISSLFVAIFLIPLLSTKFLKNHTSKKQKKSIQFKSYKSFLNKVLDKSILVMTLALILIIGSYFLIPVIGSEFMPKTNSSEITLEIKLDEGTGLELTASTVSSLEHLITEIVGEDLKYLYSNIGASKTSTSDIGSLFNDENYAELKIVLNDESIGRSGIIINNLMQGLEVTEDIEISISTDKTPLAQILGTEDTPIVIEIKGDDLEVLEAISEQVKSKLLAMDELSNIQTSFEKGAPEIDVQIDRVRAGLFNLGVNEISSQVQDKLSGKDAGDWEYEGEMKDITLSIPDVSLLELENMILNSGTSVIRLNEVAVISEKNAPKEINRRNQSRIGKITSQLNDNVIFDHIVKKITNELSDIPLEPNYKIEVAGQELKRQESMSNLVFAFLLSIILVYMALASQFESLLYPFTILLTIPLAGVGAVFIFLILGMPFNIMAFIGIIMLVGIAVNDSIILVDAINQLKKEGLELRAAIIEAGTRRIRPIVMTSLTTILALLPLTLGIGEGASLRSPMALAVIGGLITSTILTLIVIPCVYLSVDKLKEKFNFSK
ncbi:MAG: efflux RND transporter permease subunit [Melioribacteraceae bacterium]|nr:efflux RND transporter permease subunit [Melioribacteraceae bacterium]